MHCTAFALLSAAAACGEDPPKFSAPMTLGGQQVSAAVLNEGHRSYEMRCASCHGRDGSGQDARIQRPHRRRPARNHPISQDLLAPLGRGKTGGIIMMTTVGSIVLHDSRDHFATRRGDQSLERRANFLSEAVETRFLRGSERIPLLRQPVAIDKFRAGFSGMYAPPSAATRTCGSAFSRSGEGGAGHGFATPCTTTQANVGDDGLVSSRGREVSSLVRSPRTVN